MTATPHEPLIVSSFLRLPRSSVKHAYSFEYRAWQNALQIPGRYALWCSQPECAQINRSRASFGHVTDVHEWSLAAQLELLSRALGASGVQVKRAAQLSVHKQHCPSAEVIQIWLAKLMVMRLAMRTYPDYERFAWVDASINVYRVLRRRPPPPPWRTFWPRSGRIAVRRLPGACHNEIRGATHSACVVATFMYGTRRAWRDFIARYVAHVSALVAAAGSEPRGLPMLCTEQDLLEDVAASAPALIDEFTTADAGGWGWANAARPAVMCGRGETNLADACVREPDIWAKG